MFWLVAKYKPTALFSLRNSLTTSSGGKTLFVPTPYSVKLAMIDAAYRLGQKESACDVFDLVCNKDIRFKPPAVLVVNHTFIRIKRKPKQPMHDKPYIPSIGFREFGYFYGELLVALNIDGISESQIAFLIDVCAHINYFGKRGSFMQFLAAESTDELSQGYTIAADAHEMKSAVYGVVQHLDDIGENSVKDLFDRLDSFKPDKRIMVGVHRKLVPTFLPYRLIESSVRYSRYSSIVEA